MFRYLSLNQRGAGRRCRAAMGEEVGDEARRRGDGESLYGFGPVRKIVGSGEEDGEPYQQQEAD